MARTKQVSVRRESSSEFFNKQTASWVDTDGRGDKLQVTNGYAAAADGPALGSATPEAGVVQLFISVAGIYASL
ncbi:UDP-galactose transporter [Metarhizium acridum]|nr:UDP-galactose transporter [Metarhizium acridum]